MQQRRGSLFSGPGGIEFEKVKKSKNRYYEIVVKENGREIYRTSVVNDYIDEDKLIQAYNRTLIDAQKSRRQVKINLPCLGSHGSRKDTRLRAVQTSAGTPSLWPVYPERNNLCSAGNETFVTDPREITVEREHGLPHFGHRQLEYIVIKQLGREVFRMSDGDIRVDADKVISDLNRILLTAERSKTTVRVNFSCLSPLRHDLGIQLSELTDFNQALTLVSPAHSGRSNIRQSDSFMKTTGSSNDMNIMLSRDFFTTNKAL